MSCTESAEASCVSLDREAVGHYVLGRRTPAGGYSYYRTPEWGVEEPNAPDTLAAIESLQLLGIAVPEPEVTDGWLQTLQGDDGGYPTLTIGWAALRALRALGRRPARSPAEWLQRIAARLSTKRSAVDQRGTQLDGRGTLRDTLRFMELVRLGDRSPSTEERRVAGTLLDATHDPSGGWARPSADLETTAIALHASELAGLPWSDRATITSFVRHCEDTVLGLRIAPTARTTSAGILLGGLELARALGLALRHRQAIATNLALLQRADGGLGARHRAISTLQDTWQGLRAAHLLDEHQEES